MSDLYDLPDPAEKEAALRKIRRLMAFWQISPDDLGTPLPRPVSAPAPPPVLYDYRHPRTGETWQGSGPQPQWLKDALIREGYTVDELRTVRVP